MLVDYCNTIQVIWFFLYWLVHVLFFIVFLSVVDAVALYIPVYVGEHHQADGDDVVGHHHAKIFSPSFPHHQGSDAVEIEPTLERVQHLQLEPASSKSNQGS